jgi:hypothetical protein
MANYSDIKGFTVQTVSSDPAASRVDTGSWSSGASLNLARSYIAGAGTATAAIASGGFTPGTGRNETETWDGSTWTETGDLSDSKYGRMPFGTSTSQVVSGGTPGKSSECESWNGSSWTEIAELNTARSDGAGFGSSNTAGYVVTGRFDSPNYQTLNENWNGSSWTESAENNTARMEVVGAGKSTSSAIIIGGYTGSYVNNVELWDGSSWTEVNEINTTRSAAGNGASGTGTDALVFGGDSGGGTASAVTEAWNGTSFTEVNDLATAIRLQGGAGASSASALSFGGYISSMQSGTEVWTTTPAETFQKTVEGQLFFNSTANAFKETIKDIPAGTWASVAGLNTGRTDASSAGSATSALMFGGRPSSSPDTNITESWNGSAWTEVNDLNTPRGNSMTGLGLSNSNALSAGGTGPSGPSQRLVNAESWNGSSWTEVNDLNTARNSGGSSGSSTSGLVFAGMTPPYTGKTESWDGTSWTEVNDLNTARYSACVGIGVNNTDAMCVGGFGSTYDDEVETWDGSSWTEVNDLNTAKYGLGASVAGTSTNAMVFGGQKSSSPTITDTETWNGTSWTEQNNLAQARVTPSGSGTGATSALAFGGNGPGTTRYTDTEQWTAPLANKTITAS